MRSLVALVGVMLLSLTLWAADISGTWSAAVQLDAGSGTATFVLKQNGETLSGTYSGALGTANVTGTIKGSAVEWSFENADAGKCVYKGTLEGASKITGSVEYGQLGKGAFTAEKK
jgi:hypothetical protein